MRRNDPDHIGVWGRTKSGKSTRVKLILSDTPRFVVMDPLGEYGDVAGMTATTLQQVLFSLDARWYAPSLAVRYVPPRTVDPVDALERLCALLFKVQEPYQSGRDYRQLILAVDELADAAPNVQRKAGQFDALARRGRHWGIGIIGSSQRMASVTTTFRGNTTQDYFFPLREARDYDAAGALIGRERIADLRALVPHTALHFADGRVTRVTNPSMSRKRLAIENREKMPQSIG
jgi:hypothetical protein